MKNIQFQLLGKADASNPAAISLSQIQQWEAEGLITYLGSKSDIRDCLMSAACVILPSYREGAPRVLLEAMAMGKPIITTNAIGCKDLIDNPQAHKDYQDLSIGNNGILCQPKDPHSLQRAIEYFLNLSPLKREQMGQNALQYVKNFDIKHTINIYHVAIAQTPIKSPSLAFVSNTAFGMYNFRLEVLKALQNQGFAIHILCPQDTYSALLEQEGFSIHPITLDSKGLNPLKDLKTLIKIRKILHTLKPSLCFNYTIKAVIYASLASQTLKIPTINIITGLGYVFIGNSFKKRLLRTLVTQMYRFALRHTQAVWFLNADDRQEFCNRGIIPLAKSTLLQSEGINLEYFSPKKHNTNAHNARAPIIFLLIARMLWDKGISEFVAVAKHFKAKDKPKTSPTTPPQTSPNNQ
ncbi:hypothetical protein BKH46_01970 [Helicobacter sp. 12S02634-8]|uniref:glycosyltransferase n=1 Tax=Helicobacter sp. 12S02634-8 TaxID=1476199 RepID=UPI000BCFC5AC|nr:glycosyltransferase [Helicobacter sp. 12S02634-8]PAF48102.1 hypothetical protein BKH46_01970 [Helicobacter sp. 12S02634-8]